MPLSECREREQVPEQCGPFWEYLFCVEGDGEKQGHILASNLLCGFLQVASPL